LPRVGIYPNLHKLQALPVASELGTWLDARGCDWVVSPEVAGALGQVSRGMPPEAWAPGVELVVVLGGDGTLLDAARRLRSSIPLLGVNLGRLGFLTEFELKELYQELPGFLAGEYQVDERIMMAAAVIRNGDPAARFFALNDVVIAKGPFARLVKLELRVNQDYVDTYHADGLIVSTPTGSTAYSLSAGGPLVSPGLDALVVTPICPHSLYSRSLVISSQELVTLCLPSFQAGTVLTADGQAIVQLAEGDCVNIRTTSERVRLLRRPGWSFFDVLRRKLRESSQGEA
jgi:NAD+ kinase